MKAISQCEYMEMEAFGGSGSDGKIFCAYKFENFNNNNYYYQTVNSYSYV